MPISFPSLPETIRLPFAYAEFDPSGASDDASLMPYTCLMVGQMLPSGTAGAHSLHRPLSKAQADALFGRGSQLAQMCAAYLKANPVTRMLAIPVPDERPCPLPPACAASCSLAATRSSRAT